MIKIIDLKGEVGKLPMLRDRRPETTEAERKASGAFVTLSPYRDGNIFCAKFSGDAAWERHPSGDELVQVVDGGTILHVITEEGPLSYALNAGMVVVVPQNMWHRSNVSDSDAEADRASDGRCRGPTDPHRRTARGGHRTQVALIQRWSARKQTIAPREQGRRFRSHLDLRSVADFVEQIKMVAEEHNHRELTLPPVPV